MRFLYCFLLVLGPLLAQNAGSNIVDESNDVIGGGEHSADPNISLYSEIHTSWTITETANNNKEFTYSAVQCTYPIRFDPTGLDITLTDDPSTPLCLPLSASVAFLLGPIQAGLDEFYSIPDVNHLPPVYSPQEVLGMARPRAATVQPTMPSDPHLILFDGIGWSMDKVDLNTFAVTQVPLNSNLTPFVNTFGVRPATTGNAHEVWVASPPSPGTMAISIADFNTGQIATGIPGLALGPDDNPVNVIFTGDGLTALVAVSQTPDAAGNNGAILAFDAVGRTLKSRLPIKDAPQQLLISPDGLTAYSLGITGPKGTITYYDVLSGTADLVAPFTYFIARPGSGAVIHPDGTRIFCTACGASVVVFDLKTRQFSGFNVSAPATGAGGSTISANMSQDGSVMAISDNLGNVYMLDTRYGNTLTTYQNATPSMVFPGAPVN